MSEPASEPDGPAPPNVLVVDIDGTLAGPAHQGDYANCPINQPLVARLRDLSEKGFRIHLFTARGMRTHAGDIDSISQHVLPGLVRWLEHHAVPFDTIQVGKPWPGPEGFYVDDRAVRPRELLEYDLPTLEAVLNRDSFSMTQIDISKE